MLSRLAPRYISRFVDEAYVPVKIIPVAELGFRINIIYSLKSKDDKVEIKTHWVEIDTSFTKGWGFFPKVHAGL